MANSSVRPSPRTVLAHAGAAHAARRVTPRSIPGTQRLPSPQHMPAEASPVTPCTSHITTVSWRGTQSGKHPSCSVHSEKKWFCAAGLPGLKFSLCIWSFWGGLAKDGAPHHRGEGGLWKGLSIPTSHTWLGTQQRPPSCTRKSNVMNKPQPHGCPFPEQGGQSPTAQLQTGAISAGVQASPSARQDPWQPSQGSVCRTDIPRDAV